MQPPPVLRVFLRGPMRAEDAFGRSVLPKGRKARALLALLALAAPRPILRSQLISLLWSTREQTHARGSLRQSLHELQIALGPLAARQIDNDRSRVALRDDGLEVVLAPADAFDRSMLLEDLGGIDSALDAYLRTERNRLNHRSVSEAQEALSAAVDPPAILSAARTVIALDRANEKAWQAMIRARLEQGDRDSAIEALEECQTALAETAGTGPSPATLALLDPPRPAASGLISSPRLRLGICAFRAPDGPVAPGLAVGLTEELVLALASFRWMSCVPLFSVSDAAGPRLLQNPELDCVVEGSVQEVQSRLRISMRLLDLRNGGEVIWAARFDPAEANPLRAQEEVAAEAVSRIEARLQRWEARHAFSHAGAPSTVRALLSAALVRLFRLDRAEFVNAGEHLEQVLKLDPGNPAANAWLGQWHLFALGQGWAENAETATARARDLSRIALTLAPDDGNALALAGHVCAFIEKEPAEAMRLLDLAIEANPHAPIAWARSAVASSYAGQHDVALKRAERARSMALEHPLGFLFESALAVPLLLRGEYERAVTAGERSIALNPEFSSSLKTQLAALGHLGRIAEAERIRGRLLRLEPSFSVAQAMDRSPLRMSEDRERYAEGLRLGGLR